MLLHEFYEHILPLNGIYAIFRSSTKEHFWVESIDELVELTERYADLTDTYFATATFIEDGSRKQTNVEALKSFRLDLDAGVKKLATQGPDKVYATQQDALRDFIRFSQETELAPSLIVSSGEGLHIYYELDTPINSSAWTKVAKSLQRFGVKHGLKIDSSVTADSARVLRPIGTQHPNGKTVRLLKHTGKVYDLSEFYGAVATGDTAEDDWAAGANFTDTDVNEAVVVQGPPKDMGKILERCANVSFAFENQHKVDEPYWRAMIGITKHVIDGEQWAHKVSDQHPDYSKRKTQEKFDRWETGPTTCEKFGESNAKACAGCPHKGKVKSPISLGAMTTVEVEALPEELKPQVPEPVQAGNPWDGYIPKGFDVIKYKGSRTLVNYMDIEKENDLGDMVTTRITVPVSHEIFWFGHWSDAENADDTAKATVFRLDHGGRVSAFVMDQSLVASRAELSKFMAGKGIHTATDKRSLIAMEHYTKSQLQRVKVTERREKVSDHLGLRILADGRLVSAHGKYIIFPDGSISEAILNPALRSIAEGHPLPIPHNTIGEWGPEVWREHIAPKAKRHVRFLKTHYGQKGLEKYQLAVMMGLASPFMAFVTGAFLHGTTLPANGLTVSLYSRESGRGKTTVMHSAILAYGSPAALSRDQNKISATDLARTAKLSMAGTMPACMDEMGSTDSRSITALISAVANGAAREKLTKDGALVSGSPWALIAMLATNRSQRDMISEVQEESGAVQYRLLELDVDNMPEFDSEVRFQFEKDWKGIADCAGALGGVIQLIIAKKGAEWMSKFMAEKVYEASKCVTMDSQSARFQYRGLAAVLALQELLEANGFAFFNRDSLIEAFRVAHDSARDYIEENVTSVRPMEVLSKALFDLATHTAITIHETKRSGSIATYDQALNRVPDTVKARHVVSLAVTYVAVDALRKWCAEKHIRMSELINSAKSNGVLRRVYASSVSKQWAGSFNLLKGMKENTGTQVSCYAFNTLELSKRIDGDHNKDLIELLKNNVVAIKPTEDAA